MSGPPANPSETVTPPGSGIGAIPRSSPSASPRPNVRMSTSLAARYESPKKAAATASWRIGPRTRTRSPISRRSSSSGSRSTSPRRTRVMTTPSVRARSSSRSGRPATSGFDTKMRRRSNWRRSRSMRSSAISPSRCTTRSSSPALPTTVTRSPGTSRASGAASEERLAAADPPEDDAPAEPAHELLDRERSHVLRHADRRARERLVRGAQLREPLALCREVRLPAPPRHADGEHDADDAHRVADGVGDHRLRDGAVGSRLLERLDRGGERRRVGEGAREEPRGDGGVEPERALGERGERGRERHGPHRERRGAEPVAPERGDEGAAGGEPHRVDEDGEPEHVDDLGERERRVECARGEADEEDRRHAEAAAADVEPPERIADRGDEEEEQQRVRCEDPDERVCHAAARNLARAGHGRARRACGVGARPVRPPRAPGRGRRRRCRCGGSAGAAGGADGARAP